MSDIHSWGQQSEQNSSNPWLIGVATAIGVAVVTMVIWFLCMTLIIGSIEATSVLQNNLRVGYVLSAISVIAAVFAIFYIVVRLTRRGSLQFWLGVAAAGYFLNFLSWGGSAVGIRNVLWIGDLGTPPGFMLTFVGWLVDLVVWLGVAALAVTISSRQIADQGSTRRLS